MGLLDTIKANKVNAEKASTLDALEQEHVANRIKTIEADNAALTRILAPMYAARTADVMNQGLASTGRVTPIGYADGLSAEDAYKLKAAQDAEFANTARQNYDNSRQYIADDRTLKNVHWDTPEAYEAIKRSDAFDNSIDQGLAAQWRGSYR
jgi:hypothetical protein